MPVMDGFEAAKAIVSLLEEKGIKPENQPAIVALTGHVEQEYKMKATSSGIQKVLSKPISKEILGSLLHSLNYDIEWEQKAAGKSIEA